MQKIKAEIMHYYHIAQTTKSKWAGLPLNMVNSLEILYFRWAQPTQHYHLSRKSHHKDTWRSKSHTEHSPDSICPFVRQSYSSFAHWIVRAPDKQSNIVLPPSLVASAHLVGHIFAHEPRHTTPNPPEWVPSNPIGRCLLSTQKCCIFFR